MKQSAFFLILILLSGKIYSQNLDSLFNAFINSRNQTELSPLPSEISGGHSHILTNEKCGFGLSAIVRENFQNFSVEQQRILKQMFSRPGMDTSIVSPSGKFRIHFDRYGNNRPNYSGINIPQGADTVGIMMDSLAAAFDYSYNYEINILGYNIPPTDNGDGGDDLYDIYVQNLGNGNYGSTDFDAGSSTKNLPSYIYIDNDFIGSYNSFGIDAARATAAHEFHHMIQVGGYIYSTGDLYYHETSSTAMEEFAYDYVNDYYAYMPGYFNNISRRFSSGSGYDFAIWNIYLEKRFGHNILKRIWEIMATDKSALNAISISVFEFSSTFKDELNFFGQQIFFTNYRSTANTIFDEAENYPLVKLSTPYPGSTTINHNSNLAANNYFLFAVSKGDYTDSLISIVTNSDINNNVSFEYSFLTSPESGASKIVNNYYYKLNSNNPGMVKASNIFNNEPIIGDIEKGEIEFPYPQPFSYAKKEHEYIFIPVTQNETGQAFLNIYSISMDLKYSGMLNIISGNKISLMWNGYDKNNAKLPTGVYIYVTKSGDEIKKGKLVIYNE